MNFAFGQRSAWLGYLLSNIIERPGAVVSSSRV